MEAMKPSLDVLDRIAGNICGDYTLCIALKSEACEFSVCGLLTQYCRRLQVKNFCGRKVCRFPLKNANRKINFPANISSYTVYWCDHPPIVATDLGQ